MTTPWLEPGERVLWTGRSSVVTFPWQGLGVALLILGGSIALVTLLDSGSPIVLAVLAAVLLYALASVVRSRRMDRYVVTDRRAVIARGESVRRQVAITTPKLRFGGSRAGHVEWGDCDSSALRRVTEGLGLLDNTMTFDHVTDIESLYVVIRNARAAQGIDTPELP